MIIVYACNFLATFTGRWESWQRRKASPEAGSYAEVAVWESELLARGSRSKPSASIAPSATDDAYAVVQWCSKVLKPSMEDMVVEGGGDCVL